MTAKYFLNNLLTNAIAKAMALLNHRMISPNLERIFNGFNQKLIPHLCNALDFKRQYDAIAEVVL
ncbi:MULTISPECIES: hypothetical protein [unclassified Nostoc]|uniref:hypothetical protein n=1 Tax=unclassified Nostoc TaxID=2593658 RepID=UPI00167553AC|nr:hypothetical protein [Nostoc sp. 'Peltigera membranacea cyanobiont' 232]